MCILEGYPAMVSFLGGGNVGRRECLVCLIFSWSAHFYKDKTV